MNSPAWVRSPFPAPHDDRITRRLSDALLDVADRQPDDIAVIDRGHRYRFAELAARTGGIAEQLRRTDAPLGPVAGIQSMGIDMVASWFACAASGRPLVILDPHNPVERNRELIALTQSCVLLHDKPSMDSPNGINVRSCVPAGVNQTLPREAGLSPAEPAMIFPTSGSTGVPKLVAYAAETMQAKVQASIQLMQPQRGDVVLIAGSHGNFGYVHHALTFLLAGGTLCLFDLAESGLEALARTIETEKVRHVRFTPSLFRLIARLPAMRTGLKQLRGLRFSGEPLLWSDVEMARSIVEPTCRIQNVYGSTESAIFLWNDDRTLPPSVGAAPIGHIYPLWEYALDTNDAGSTMAADEGHLIVRSRYQALGDFNNGSLDGSRFPPDPEGGGRRLYLTGDLVRRGTAGELTMIDRLDRIIKINGQRISPTEIEMHLRAMPGCAAAHVLVCRGALAAFLVSDSEVGQSPDPRGWLAARLPRHMVPGRIRTIERLPLLPGGKIDHVGLVSLLDDDDPAPIRSQTSLGDPWAMLEDIWSRALDRPEAATRIDQDFFDLGGDSLRFLNLRMMVEEAFGQTLDDRLLDRPTLRQLAGQLEIAVGGTHPSLTMTIDGTPRFYRVRPAIQPCKGIALVMPGHSGSAVVDPLIAVETLPSHEIWACDVSWPMGHMMHDQRWISVAQQIAKTLASDDQIRPDILIGYSIAGYIAWLVDRLLSSTQRRPKLLICLDSLAMHRQPAYKSTRLRKIIRQTEPVTPSSMLLVHRSTCPGVKLPEIDRPRWTSADGHITTIDFQTVEHSDMVSRSVLTTAAPYFDAFECGIYPPATDARSSFAVNTDGGQVYKMLLNPLETTSAQIEDATECLMQSGSHVSSTVLLYLAILRADKRLAERVAKLVLVAHPYSTATRYGCHLVTMLDNISPSRASLTVTDPQLKKMSSMRKAFLTRRQDISSRGLWYLKLILHWHASRVYISMRLHNQRYRFTTLKELLLYRLRDNDDGQLQN